MTYVKQFQSFWDIERAGVELNWDFPHSQTVEGWIPSFVKREDKIGNGSYKAL